MKKLHGELFFSVEKYEKKWRFIISDPQAEVACRKEMPSKILKFLAEEEGAIFKGRLQLSKQKNKIVVWLKNEVIGSINVEEFKNLLPV